MGGADGGEGGSGSGETGGGGSGGGQNGGGGRPGGQTGGGGRPGGGAIGGKGVKLAPNDNQRAPNRTATGRLKAANAKRGPAISS